MSLLLKIAIYVTIIGALNWGLLGFFQFDIVSWIFHGTHTVGARFFYSLVGVSGLYTLMSFMKCPSLGKSRD